MSLETPAPHQGSQESFTCQRLIEARHPDFEGHFENFPLLPAVSQIELIKELLECWLQKPLVCVGIKKAKFKAMLRPNTEVRVEIFAPQNGQARWTISRGEEIYSTGIFIFAQRSQLL